MRTITLTEYEAKQLIAACDALINGGGWVYRGKTMTAALVTIKAKLNECVHRLSSNPGTDECWPEEIRAKIARDEGYH